MPEKLLAGGHDLATKKDQTQYVKSKLNQMLYAFPRGAWERVTLRVFRG